MMAFEVGKKYEVVSEFFPPVLNGHEVGGIWSEHASVALDPGNKFSIVEVGSSGWHVAEMSHNLWFADKRLPSGSFSWKGKFYVREDSHLKNLKEVK